MASSADDLVAKVAEALDESLLVAIGAVCSTPNQTANKCHELGITTEGEKLAKWVAVLKRDSCNLFGVDFLSKLKEIHDKKFPAEELKMEEKTQNPAEAVESATNTEKELTEADYEKLWKEYFLKPWVVRIKHKLARYEYEGLQVEIGGDLRSFFLDENEENISFYMKIDVAGRGFNDRYYFLLFIEGRFMKKSLIKKDAYKNAKLDVLRIYGMCPTALKKATTLEKWLKTQKTLVKKVVVIKDF